MLWGFCRDDYLAGQFSVSAFRRILIREGVPVGTDKATVDKIESSSLAVLSWSEQIKKVFVEFLPSPLKNIVERGLLRALLVLILVIVVLPPLVALLAAYWLGLLANVERAEGLRVAYLKVIHDGFSIEEVASRSNVRLDYQQLFEFDLRPKTNPSREIRWSLERTQKAAIDVRVVAFKADDPSCTLPEEDLELVTVFIGDQPLRTLKQEFSATIEIDKDWWQANAPKFSGNDLVQRLSFKLTAGARQLTCGRAHIEGSVRVFKDIYTQSPKKVVQ
jgi:hypothetical protein